MTTPLLRTGLVVFTMLSFTACRQPTSAADRSSAGSLQIARFLKAGMTSAQIETVISEKRPGQWWHDYATLGGEIGPARCFEFGDGSCVLISFARTADPIGNIGDGDMAASITPTHFDDLKKEFPPELFPAIRLIHLSPSPAEHFDPVALIRAVNGLMPLGKEKVLKAMREYERVAAVEDVPTADRAFKYAMDEQRIFLILRLLFIRADGSPVMPDMVIGMPSTSAVQSDKDTPLFPLIVIDDIPFWLAGGYSLGGAAQPPSEHIDYCEKNRVLRKEPLSPTGSPLKIAERAFSSTLWKRIHPEGDDGSRYYLREQALRCVSNLLVKPDLREMDTNCISAKAAAKAWRSFLEAPTLQNVAWDEKAQRFVSRKSDDRILN